MEAALLIITIAALALAVVAVAADVRLAEEEEVLREVIKDLREHGVSICDNGWAVRIAHGDMITYVRRM